MLAGVLIVFFLPELLVALRAARFVPQQWRKNRFF
jgi:hypothetical protein